MFPLPKGGGSIEGSVFSLRIGDMRRFHCRKAVAPLKGGAFNGVPPAIGVFPLPKGGGSIEGFSLISSRLRVWGVSTAERRWLH